MPTNGSAQLIAQVIEPAGTPPHKGTHIIFTTTLGIIEPSDTTTDIDGRAVVMFKAGAANGVATITAASGGAAVASANALRIAVGAAAVGAISASANPAVIGASGGNTTISARVFDTSGNVLPNVPVTFSTNAGSVAPTVATTDQSGIATSVLTTNRTATVTVAAGIATTGGGTGTGGGTTTAAPTATVTVNVNSVATITVGTVVPAAPAVGQVVSIPLTYAAAGGTAGTSPITSLRVDWGDGQIQNFNGQPNVITHRYNFSGSFVVLITGFDSLGDTTSATAAVTVQNGQPSVGITASNDNPAAGASVTFTINATVPGQPTGVAIQNITVDFGDGKSASLGAGLTSVAHTYTAPGTYVATAVATTTTGASGSGSTTVVVR